MSRTLSDALCGLLTPSEGVGQGRGRIGLPGPQNALQRLALLALYPLRYYAYLTEADHE